MQAHERAWQVAGAGPHAGAAQLACDAAGARGAAAAQAAGRACERWASMGRCEWPPPSTACLRVLAAGAGVCLHVRVQCLCGAVMT